MLYLISIFSFFILFVILNKIAPTLNLIDKPDARKKHIGYVPLIGGLLIYLNIFVFMFFFEVNVNMKIVMLVSIILILLGALDDIIELGILFRLIAQLACCLIVIGSGLYITHIGDYMTMPRIEIGIFSIIFTIFCVVGLTNAFNFIDGVDGLCSTLALLAIISVIIISYFENTIIYMVDLKYLILISISLILFIFFNINNKFKIFLGDAGSMFLGFFVSWFLIMVSQGYDSSQGVKELVHPVLTMWCVSLPVFDIFSVIIRRILQNKNPFKPDRTHIHHILLRIGYRPFHTTCLIIILAIILNFFGILIYYISGALPTLISFILFLVIYVIFMIHLSKRANIK